MPKTQKNKGQENNSQQQQQQLPKSSRLCGVWGDPDVHDLTPTHTRHIERPVPVDPQKHFRQNKTKQ